MSNRITKEELEKLFGAAIPIDVLHLLFDLTLDLGEEEWLINLRKVIDLRAQAWHRQQMDKQVAADRIAELENQIAELRWTINPPTDGY